MAPSRLARDRLALDDGAATMIARNILMPNWLDHRRSVARWAAQGVAGLAIAVPVCAGLFQPARAEPIKIGSLTVANVGPIYIAKEKGYFAAEGLEVALSSFDAAQPVAVAVA